MNAQEFSDTSRRYQEELLKMYRSQSMEPSPKPASDDLPSAEALPLPISMPIQAEMPTDAGTEESHFGTIRVRVMTAKGARPVPNATVMITKEGDDGSHELLSLQMTNESGETQNVEVPSPPPSEDQRNPAAFHYDAAVFAAGYYRESSRNIPVFPDIVSVQTFDLIPLPTGAEDARIAGTVTFYNPTPHF